MHYLLWQTIQIAPNFFHWNAHIFLFGLILWDIPNSITPQTTLRLLPTSVVLVVLPCTHQYRQFPPPPPYPLHFFFLSRTEEPAKARPYLCPWQQLTLNVSDLTWPDLRKSCGICSHFSLEGLNQGGFFLVGWSVWISNTAWHPTGVRGRDVAQW